MTTTKTKIVLGAGAILVMLGIAVGSGAFTQVSAERTANVNVADDADAYLSLVIEVDVPDPENYTFENQAYVSNTTGTQGQTVIQFNFDAAGGGANGNGLNDDAVTTFDNVFMIENQAGKTVQINYSISDSGSAEVITLYQSTDSTSELSSVTLNQGETQYVGFEFNTTTGSVADTVEITITADDV